jgi:hypothetical protein
MVQTGTENAGTHRPTREGSMVARVGARPPRDVKNEGTSGDMYENKGQATICPTQKDSICAQSHALLQKNTRILH